MRKLWGVIGATLLVLALIPRGGRTSTERGGFWPSVIYGEDNRKDLYEVRDARYLKLAFSTAALFRNDDIQSVPGSGQTKLRTKVFGMAAHLCQDEPFYSQPTGAFCSAALVGPKLMMTAGHCITSQSDCDGISFVFGFGITEKDRFPESVPSREVFRCKKLVNREQNGDGADYALVELDREVLSHAPLEINRSGGLAPGDELVLIGHPSGLPTKVADGAAVRQITGKGYFVANTDSYGGNSGSPVFSAKTGLIEGILVRGEFDFESRGQCIVSKRCGESECRGEDVTDIAALASQVPPLRERS